MKSLFSKNQSGQSLVEALLALAFVVAIITAVVTVVISSLNSASFTKNQNRTTSYAQEGLDIARNMKDSNYTVFRALPSRNYYCADEATITLKQTCVAGVFTRKIYVDHGDATYGGRDEKLVGRCEVGSSFVASIVYWTDSKCAGSNNCHKVQLDSCFSDLNKVSGP